MHYDAPVKLIGNLQAAWNNRKSAFMIWFKNVPQPASVIDIVEASKVPEYTITLLLKELEEEGKLQIASDVGITRYYSIK